MHNCHRGPPRPQKPIPFTCYRSKSVKATLLAGGGRAWQDPGVLGSWSIALRKGKWALNQGVSSHFIDRLWDLQVICCCCCYKNKIVVIIGVCSRLVREQRSGHAGARVSCQTLAASARETWESRSSPNQGQLHWGKEQTVPSLCIWGVGHVLRQTTVTTAALLRGRTLWVPSNSCILALLGKWLVVFFFNDFMVD